MLFGFLRFSFRKPPISSILLKLWIFWFKEAQAKLNEFGQSTIHGKGYDRWFDKSFNLIILKNGQVKLILSVLRTPLRQIIVSRFIMFWWDFTGIFFNK